MIIKQSLLKLEKSFDALDNALLKQAKGNALQANLSQDIDLLVQDRSQLASQLDDAKAKIDSLQNINQLVEKGIDAIMGELTQMLDTSAGD
ncbi:MAG: DUF4164 family protein [Rhizobiales bacterium]|nr:DUF4164 domain-containing protein [Hyphomicrobiales bacterium]NRB14169.1 DUF4164 family protein [Hyphomicrobiales bacterium]